VKPNDDALAESVEGHGNRAATELVIACCRFDPMSRLLGATRVEPE